VGGDDREEVLSTLVDGDDGREVLFQSKEV